MNTRTFAQRHIGIDEYDLIEMLKTIGVASLDELIEQVIPQEIRLTKELKLPPAMSEIAYADFIRNLANKNEIFTTYIGQGWYDTATPAAIIRNVFENPVWYTSYTPYQAEISQGRLEALLNFQTMVCELTAMELSNCSLLDEATAGAEAVAMMFNLRSREQIKNGANKLFLDSRVFDQTKAVINTRALPQGIEVVEGEYENFQFTSEYFGAIAQHADTYGTIHDLKQFITQAHEIDARVAIACDILSLALLTPPGEWGADICFGTTQRLGIPLFYGGPSAAYFAARDASKRFMPGRIIGISKDRNGKRALRMALQTREQHIKREKATSNICTSQALLATMSSFFGVYMGPDGLKNIAKRIHHLTKLLASELIQLGYIQRNSTFFDTLQIQLPERVNIDHLRDIALKYKVNLHYHTDQTVGISINETTTDHDISILITIFSEASHRDITPQERSVNSDHHLPDCLIRTSEFMQQEVFNAYHTETELMRYIKKLERRDLSLTHSMIPLGSCTMKLNAASELLPLTNPLWNSIHPYAPVNQAGGYQEMIQDLSNYLCEITGMHSASFQPNSGAAGEYAGLMSIRAYHHHKGEPNRNIVLIPASAHGTNPASAAQCGFEIVTIICDEQGNVDMEDMKIKAQQHKDNLAALMITYPSTHGIFEEQVVACCELIHHCGGQVYMDGANMNAQVALTNPGTIGVDVCHLNLHKTFAIPHGGGGPGMGPIFVKEHLSPFLPRHPFVDGSKFDTVSSAPYGSAGVLLISYAYIRMMGTEGLKKATQTAILNANYIAAKLKSSYGIVYSGKEGRVGHELILECRKLKTSSGIDETDIAKRLIDYGYHAPTLSFPVVGTLMIEPTESESLRELNRFCEVMNSIFQEAKEVESGRMDKIDNPLKNAPHPQYEICSDEWTHPYSRQLAAFPLDWIAENKFWVNVGRVDNASGDRNLIAKIMDPRS